MFAISAPMEISNDYNLTLPVILSLSIVYLVQTILFEKPKATVMIIDRINRTSRDFFKRRMIIR